MTFSRYLGSFGAGGTLGRGTKPVMWMRRPALCDWLLVEDNREKKRERDAVDEQLNEKVSLVDQPS